MLVQRRPDEQVYVGPTTVSNVEPMESTTEKQRSPNVVMLSGSRSVFGPCADPKPLQFLKFLVIFVGTTPGLNLDRLP